MYNFLKTKHTTTHMCGGREDHGCKNLAHTSKSRQVKRSKWLQLLGSRFACLQGRNDGGGKWGTVPGRELLWGCRITAGAPKSPNNVTSTFFNTVHLVPKELRFEHGVANLLLAPGAI